MAASELPGWRPRSSRAGHDAMTHASISWCHIDVGCRAARMSSPRISHTSWHRCTRFPSHAFMNVACYVVPMRCKRPAGARELATAVEPATAVSPAARGARKIEPGQPRLADHPFALWSRGSGFEVRAPRQPLIAMCCLLQSLAALSPSPTVAASPGRMLTVAL